MSDIAQAAAAVAFLMVDRRPADAVVLPGHGTYLVVHGQGQALVDDWKAGELPVSLGANCLRLGEPRPDAPEPEPEAMQEEDPSTDACVQQALDAADTEWLTMRDRAFNSGDEAFNRLQWATDHPRPTVESVYQVVHGKPHPRPKVPRSQAAPLQAADVQVLADAWYARLVNSGNHRREDELLGAPGAFPQQGLAVLLTELRSDGWSIVHWTDERIVVHEHERSRTELVGVSIALER